MSSYTETQELFNLVQRAKHEWETTADSLSEFIGLLDEDLIVHRSNRTVSDWGLAEITEVSGKDFHNLFHPDCTDDDCYLKQFLNTAWAKLEKEGLAEVEAEDDILNRYLHIRLRPILDRETQEIASAAIIAEDITIRKQLEREREQLLAQVEEQSQLLRTILSNTPDQIYMYDENGICIYANLSAEWHLGLSETEIVGKQWSELGFPPEEEEDFHRVRDAVLEQRKRLRNEMQHRRGTGNGHYEYIVSPILTSPKVASNVIVTLRDITERVQAQKELEETNETLEERVAKRTQELSEINTILQAEVHERERAQMAEQRQREITEIMHGITLSLTRTLNMNTMLKTLLDYTKRVIPYEHAHVLMKENSSDSVSMVYSTSGHVAMQASYEQEDCVNRILESGDAVSSDTCDNTPQIVEGYHGQCWLGIPIMSGENIIGVCVLEHSEASYFGGEHARLARLCMMQAAFALDNARLFAEVSTGRERLQNLSHQLVAVQEQERRHLALELHDEIGQVLTGLKFTIQRALNSNPEEVKETLQLANKQIKEVTSQVRELSLNLRPSMLDDLGLLPALLWQFSRYTERTNIQVDFKHAGIGDTRFNDEVEIAIYRVIQEALTNIARYGNTDEAIVRVIAENDVLRVDLQDYGTGFDVEAALNRKTSTGLTGMQERIHVLDGQFVIKSSVGMGTHISVRLPLS